MVIIQIKDTGKGFNTDQSCFQGIALAEALCSQINAELLIESGDEGTTVTVKIPLSTAG